jgi:hypothetical protein
MPETAVDEDRQPLGAEHEIRPDAERSARGIPTADGLLTPPARPALGAEDPRQGFLGREVAAPRTLAIRVLRSARV